MISDGGSATRVREAEARLDARVLQHALDHLAEPLALRSASAGRSSSRDRRPTTPCERFSAAERMTATGVRSSCDTPATNSICCRASRCARRDVSASSATLTVSSSSTPKLMPRLRRRARGHGRFERSALMLHEQQPASERFLAPRGRNPSAPVIEAPALAAVAIAVARSRRAIEEERSDPRGRGVLRSRRRVRVRRARPDPIDRAPSRDRPRS